MLLGRDILINKLGLFNHNCKIKSRSINSTQGYIYRERERQQKSYGISGRENMYIMAETFENVDSDYECS